MLYRFVRLENVSDSANVSVPVHCQTHFYTIWPLQRDLLRVVTVILTNDNNVQVPRAHESNVQNSFLWQVAGVPPVSYIINKQHEYHLQVVSTNNVGTVCEVLTSNVDTIYKLYQ